MKSYDYNELKTKTQSRAIESVRETHYNNGINVSDIQNLIRGETKACGIVGHGMACFNLDTPKFIAVSGHLNKYSLNEAIENRPALGKLDFWRDAAELMHVFGDRGLDVKFETDSHERKSQTDVSCWWFDEPNRNFSGEHFSARELLMLESQDLNDLFAKLIAYVNAEILREAIRFEDYLDSDENIKNIIDNRNIRFTQSGRIAV